MTFANLLNFRMSKQINRSQDQDPRNFPTYTVAEAALLVNVAAGTIQRWMDGKYLFRSNERFDPLIVAADTNRRLLSFYNLAEAHILRITRKEFKVPMLQVRRAIQYLQSIKASPHPLLTNEFRTEGKYLFVKELEQYINASRHGQLGLAPVLDRYLQRISFDQNGMPCRIYPAVGNLKKDLSAPVMVDPKLSSGRLVIEGTGIMVAAARTRHLTGETYEQLGRDYRIAPEKIKMAVEYLEKAA
jgi:uncharacterized protein (DUF433 family)